MLQKLLQIKQNADVIKCVKYTYGPLHLKPKTTFIIICSILKRKYK